MKLVNEMSWAVHLAPCCLIRCHRTPCLCRACNPSRGSTPSPAPSPPLASHHNINLIPLLDLMDRTPSFPTNKGLRWDAACEIFILSASWQIKQEAAAAGWAGGCFSALNWLFNWCHYVTISAGQPPPSFPSPPATCRTCPVSWPASVYTGLQDSQFNYLHKYFHNLG